MPTSELTKERDLRESKPLWADTPRIGIRSGKTPEANHYDTIVVGAGISGALVAHALHRPGQSMLIVDRRDPVMGSSVASTAPGVFVNFGKTERTGLENAPDAFLELFSGGNTGKMVVRL